MIYYINICFSIAVLSTFTAAQSGDGVTIDVRPTCSGSLDSVELGDLSDKSKGPALMRDMFCGTYTTKPQGVSYELCNPGETRHCKRKDEQAGYDLEGSYDRKDATFNRGMCLEAFQYIVDDCFSQGKSSGKVELKDGSYKYELKLSVPSSTTPVQDVSCSTEALGPPQPFDLGLLSYMRDVYCAAGGCSNRTDECEVRVHGNGYRVSLQGSIPRDQSDTQFSQTCYDATEALIDVCWKKNLKGGSFTSNGEAYNWVFMDGDEDVFDETPHDV